MSIVIKSNELHTIIYKYLLEAGLSHTAYVMFNEAKLQSSLQEFKFDIKSGHLLMLLQKALIFSQIEAHVNFSEYNDCLEAFYLLKQHTCKITEKARKDKNSLMDELNKNLIQATKRSNAIYNTELVNKNYDEIIYEPRGVNYFQKFTKLKFTDNDLSQTSNNKRLKIDSQGSDQLAFYNPEDKVVYLTKNDGYDDITIKNIYPCAFDGLIQEVQVFRLTMNYLILVFNDNKVKIILREEQLKTVELIIPLTNQIKEININPNFTNIVSFQSSTQYSVININNMEEVVKEEGKLKWRSFDEYVVFSKGSLQLKSLLSEKSILTYKNNETTIDQIQISTNKTFFFITSYLKNKCTVYTFEKQEPLYEFNLGEEQETLKKVKWIYRNQIDYLAILTQTALRVWEVQFNAYCLRLDIKKYEVGQIIQLAALQKNMSQTFILIIGTENLLVSDLVNQKIQRIEAPSQLVSMQNVTRHSIYVTTTENVYFLNGDKLSELFK